MEPFCNYKEIKSRINDIQNNLSSIQPHQTSIFFMGESGAGKGTLIHYLVKNPYLYATMTETGEMRIRLLKNHLIEVQNIEIQEHMYSGTSIPQQANYKGETLKDFPGFHDNRDDKNVISKDIENQFYLKEVFHKTKRLKIVLVVTKTSLSDRSSGFVESFKMLAQSFDNISQVKNSICLVVTKVCSKLSHQNIMASLERLFSDLHEQFSSQQQELLSFLIQNKRVELFYEPQRQGKLDFSASKNIEKLIKTLEYCKLSKQIQIVLADHSLHKVQGLCEQINRQIALVCKFHFVQLFSLLFEEFLEFKVQEVQQNQRKFQEMNLLLIELYSAQSAQEFIKLLTSDKIKLLNPELLRRTMIKFKQSLQILNFIEKVYHKAVNLLCWQRTIAKIKSRLELMATKNNWKIKGTNEEILEIKSFYSTSSSLMKLITSLRENGQIPKVQKIKVITFIISLKQKIILPSTHLAIYSEFIHIDDTGALIELKGKNAPQILQETKENQNGTPGLPGECGGDLHIQCGSIKALTLNKDKLTVDLRGGNGGRGQNGGKITVFDPKQLVPLIEAEILKKEEEKQYLLSRAVLEFDEQTFFGKISYVFRKLATFNDKVIQKYSTEADKDFCLKHTIAGAKGSDGFTGRAFISGLKYESIVETNISENQKTDESKQQNFGYMEVYEGIYLKEMSFSSLRKGGKSFDLENNKVQESHHNYELFQSHKQNPKTKVDVSSNLLQENQLERELIKTIFKMADKRQNEKQLPLQQVSNPEKLHQENSPNPKTSLHRNKEDTLLNKTQQKRKQFLQKQLSQLGRSQLLELIELRALQKTLRLKQQQKQSEKSSFQISKQLIEEVGKQIASDLSEEVLQDLGSDIIGKSANAIKNLSSNQIMTASGHLGQKALFVPSVEVSLGQFALGLTQGFLVQGLLSALLASGINDKWIQKPHFVSKKVKSKSFNQEKIKSPQRTNPFSSEQLLRLTQKRQSLRDYYLDLFQFFRAQAEEHHKLNLQMELI